jgi:hypothetical protein
MNVRVAIANLTLTLTLTLAACDVFISDLGGEGESCSFTGECYGDLVCVFETCAQTPGFGEACDEYHGDIEEACADGFWCVDGECVEAGGVGQPCLPEEAFDCDARCEDGAYCVHGSCLAMGGEGEPCLCYDYGPCVVECAGGYSDENECADGFGCIAGTCVGPSPATVEQPNSGPTWLRCPLGMTWDGWRCTGTAAFLTWSAAQATCPSGYTLPMIADYISLLGDCDSDALLHYDFGDCNSCGASATCTAMFTDDVTNDPDWEGARIRSGTYWALDGPDDDPDDYAFVVDFGDGSMWGQSEPSIERMAFCAQH